MSNVWDLEDFQGINEVPERMLSRQSIDRRQSSKVMVGIHDGI